MTDTKEEREKILYTLSTLCEFFQNRVQKGPYLEALREYDKNAKKWISYTYEQTAKKVLEWRKAFAKSGFSKGERVAMLLPNGVNAICFDQAALANCLIPVPLHAIDTPASSAFILSHSGASFLVTNKLSHWEKIKEAGFDLSNIKKVIVTDDDSPTSGVIEKLNSWLDAGKDQVQLPDGPTADDLACIVYTSGTTGRPKGVMLTHRNIASNVRSTLGHVNPDDGFKLLSFLPLSHMFERTCDYLALATGCTIVFNRSLQYLAEDFTIVKPDVLISVPRVYERIYAKLQETLKKGNPLKRKLFEWGVDVGWRDFCKRNKIPFKKTPLQVLDSTAGRALTKKISKMLMDRFGGELKVAISGGAALNGKAAKLFCGLGLPILQGYGMTETSPIIAGNKVLDNNPGTVGRLLKDVNVKIGENEEILVKGDLVMKGYWKQPEETQKIISPDGWLHTGDKGEFDEQGRLKIKGRIKEIIVTSTGEKISPVDIESAVEQNELIEQCFAVGDDKPYISVIVSLNLDAWKTFANKLGLDPSDPTSLLNHTVRQKILKRVKKACSMFPAYAVPRNAWPTLDEWTIDNGLQTPTLKLKRGPMVRKYRGVIESMYKGARA
ncbi:MAG: long-chain fatty acid--CoA ligase [Burkholderiales bacterium]|nr:long-chain fatty acid--CoA ligase [Burkholderiales bacterium]